MEYVIFSQSMNFRGSNCYYLLRKVELLGLMSFGTDESAYRRIYDQKLIAYGTYLHNLGAQFVSRFHPWPKWLISCNEAFNFASNITYDTRMKAFEILMNCPFGPNPLLDDEKARLRAEFVTFMMNASKASEILKNEKPGFTQTDLWYLLLTEEKLYTDCKYFIGFAVKFINRSLNETIVGCEVSSLEDIEGIKRPLKHANSVKLNFISTNGPHPLVSLPLVKDFLTAYFGKDWHFTLANSKWFVSKVVDKHLYDAKNCSNSLE